MSEPDPDDLAGRLLYRLRGFMLGIGIDERDDRVVMMRAIADDPSLDEDGIMAKARAWMLIALTWRCRPNPLLLSVGATLKPCAPSLPVRAVCGPTPTCPRSRCCWNSATSRSGRRGPEVAGMCGT